MVAAVVIIAVLSAGLIGIGIDTLAHTDRCRGTAMGVGDTCMSVGTDLVPRGRYREELLSAAETTAMNTAAVRRHRPEVVHRGTGAETPPGYISEIAVPQYLERLTAFGDGRAVSVRDRGEQIRHNRIGGAVLLGLGAPLLVTTAVATRRLIGRRRARRARSTGSGPG